MKNPALARLQRPRARAKPARKPAFFALPPPLEETEEVANPFAAAAVGPLGHGRPSGASAPPIVGGARPSAVLPSLAIAPPSSGGDDPGVAIQAIRDLADRQAPVSAIICADTVEIARNLGPSAAEAAGALWRLGREGLGPAAREACRDLHAKAVPLAYVLLAASEAGARAVAFAATRDGGAEDDAALLWEDAHRGPSYLIWHVPASTARRVEKACAAMAARRAAHEAADAIAALA